MLFDLIEQQCEDGMAFMAVHCGPRTVGRRRGTSPHVLFSSDIPGRVREG